jgi:uncharacterized protein (DUF305 family)
MTKDPISLQRAEPNLKRANNMENKKSKAQSDTEFIEKMAKEHFTVEPEAKVAKVKGKDTQFNKYLKSIKASGPYQSYESDNNQDVMYTTSFVISTLKDIHKGTRTEDLGFQDIDEAKAFRHDWYIQGYDMYGYKITPYKD